MKKLLRDRVVAITLGIVVIVALAAFYRAKYGTADTPTQYVTTKVQRGTLVISVAGSGQVSAVNQTNIQPQISGMVTEIDVTNNQKVGAGTLLVRLDTTNDERAVRNTQASLENAQLSLQTLEQPATTSSILQAQQSVMQAQQSLTNAQNSLATDYGTAYTDIANTFIDLPGVMTGLKSVLYSTTLNKVQANVDAYSNLISGYYPDVAGYNQSAVLGYQTALTAFNQNLTDYKNTDVYSSTSTVESLLAETYATLRSVSVANSSAKNLLDVVNNVLEQNNQKAPAQLTADETSMQSLLTTTNTHLATLLQIQNALQTDKQSIITATLSGAQTKAALDQLQSGPTQLAIATQQLAITQAQNALSDAKQNLAYDYIRAPFAGIITNITAKVAQPVSSGSTLAVLVSNAQLAQATLNETDIVNVKVGQKAMVTFDVLPGVTLAGTVAQVDTIGTVVQSVVSYNVQVALDTPNPSARPGMSDTVSITTTVKPDILLVPSSAITTRQGVSTVQVLSSDGKPVQQQVTIGAANDTMTEIVSGLQEGDPVITKTVTSGASAATSTSRTTTGFGIPGLTGGGGGAARALGR
jgi:RND family efflux transporter MFP subunit